MQNQYTEKTIKTTPEKNTKSIVILFILLIYGLNSSYNSKIYAVFLKVGSPFIALKDTTDANFKRQPSDFLFPRDNYLNIETSRTIANATIAKWTFEGINTSNKGTAALVSFGSNAADTGLQVVGSEFNFVKSNSATVWSNPTGNGSNQSVSSTHWSVGDYYQFKIKTQNYYNLKISIDQMGSNTGPRGFKIQYSTDGLTFTDAIGAGSSYSIVNDTWAKLIYKSQSTKTLDLSSIRQLNNQSFIYIRLVNTSKTSIVGGLVTSNGTSRIDNFSVSGTFCSGNNWTGAIDTAWDNPGNWSCYFEPSLTCDATIAATANKPIITGVAFAQSLTIATGGALTVKEGITLMVDNAVTVATGGALTFKNNSSLLQNSLTTANSNTGNILYERNTSTLHHNYDFVYWSAPVAAQLLGKIWMASDWVNTFYTFNTNNNNWLPAYETNEMQAGIGYIARARDGASGIDYNGISTPFTVGNAWMAKFYGVPHNGTLTCPILKTTAFSHNLIGNPYPSALDLETFYQSNAELLSGNFYFWTHHSALQNNAYNASDYAVYNASLNAGVRGSGTVAYPDEISPTGYVAAGQGFFAEATASGTATFSNKHRVSANNSTFYRPAQQASLENRGIESHKIWLNLANSKGVFKQQLVAYAQGATNDYDTRLEAVSFKGNGDLDFYSNLTQKRMVIQSRPLPFDNQDIVPLGFQTSVVDTCEISIADTDGLFLAGQNIYLEDQLQQVIHDLKQGGYRFNTDSGIFNERFVLRYTQGSLSTSSLPLKTAVKTVVQDKVMVYADEKIIQSITVRDFLGRILGHYDAINASEFTIVNLFPANQWVLLEIHLDQQQVVTQKIWY
jgi:hypothetical protein